MRIRNAVFLEINSSKCVADPGEVYELAEEMFERRHSPEIPAQRYQQAHERGELEKKKVRNIVSYTGTVYFKEATRIWAQIVAPHSQTEKVPVKNIAKKFFFLSQFKIFLF